MAFNVEQLRTKSVDEAIGSIKRMRVRGHLSQKLIREISLAQQEFAARPNWRAEQSLASPVSGDRQTLHPITEDPDHTFFLCSSVMGPVPIVSNHPTTWTSATSVERG